MEILVGFIAALIKTIPLCFSVPEDSWMCPKIWYFGLISKTLSLRYSDPDDLPWELKSLMPKGGQWVTKRSTLGGIASQMTFSFHFLY